MNVTALLCLLVTICDMIPSSPIPVPACRSVCAKAIVVSVLPRPYSVSDVTRPPGVSRMYVNR